MKHLWTQLSTKLSFFWRESGEFLSLFTFLLLTAVDVAALTFNVSLIKFSANRSQNAVNHC